MIVFGLIAVWSIRQDDTRATVPTVGTEFGGTFSFSMGYIGTGLILENGRFKTTYFSCTDSGVGEEGTYTYDGNHSLSLRSVNGVRNLIVTKDGLFEKDGLNTTELSHYVRTHWEDGTECQPRVGPRGSYPILPWSPQGVRSGNVVFNAKCSSCHGMDGKVLTASSPLEFDLTNSKNYPYRSGDNPARTRIALKAGIVCTEEMEPILKALSKDELDALTVYLSTLNGSKPTYASLISSEALGE